MWKWKRYLISSRRIRTRRMSIPAANKDPILAVTEAFLADTHPTKINLGVGPYSFRDDEGRPLVFQCVRDAEARIADAQFRESALTSAVKTNLVEESVQLVYGKGADIVKERRFAGVATLSGTSACCLFAEFQHHFYPKSHIYLPVPTWSNHHNIWRGAEVPVRTFHYYHPESKGLNFAALIGDIRNAPDHSFFLLHPCAHNPTGVDPTEEQWREISYQFKVKNHFPFFDMAYQGLASGDLDRDAKAIRIFQEDGHLLGCAQSFTKIMGLYGHRIGCLRVHLSCDNPRKMGSVVHYRFPFLLANILSSDENQAIATRSQLQQIARGMFGSPPIHGSLLVSTILGDPQLKALWAKEVKAMAGRVMRRRATMRQSLEKLDSRCNWEHITNQVGMFCFTGLSPQQVDRLAREFHIYLTPEGRMSMAGVTKSNVDYLANAMHEVTRFGQEDSLQKQQYYSL